MSAFETIDYATENGVALVTLSRPEAVNAFSVQMRDDLYEVLSLVRDDSAVRGVIFSGAGERGFCSGADLAEFGTAPSQAIARRVRRQRDVWALLAAMRKPSVAAIHGYCLGSGLELACLCDLRVASGDAIFGMPEVSLGLVPAAGGTQVLPRLIGLGGTGRAHDLLLTGRRVGATEAMEIGLLTRIVPRGDHVKAATSLLRGVLTAPDGALHAAKRAVVGGADLPLGAALDLEDRLAMALGGPRA